MIGVARKMFDRFRGAGDAALTLPPLDGAFRPNSDLESAEIVLACPAPDNLTVAGGAVFLSSGGDLLRLADGPAETLAQGATITALAGHADGRLAIARSGMGLGLLDAGGASRSLPLPEGATGDITALAFVDATHLALAIGAEGRAQRDWKTDLMEKGASGSIWLLDLSTGAAQRFAGGLRYPAGLCPLPGGDLLVSLCWEHALKRFGPTGRSETVLANLPAYPWRLSPAAGGGYWLSFASIRNQLVEFVLREDLYRRAMLREIDDAHWIAPSLHPTASPLEPAQEGGQKIGGAVKPWAPSLSYGLVARIDADLLPQESFHSRAGGRRHGITSAVQHGGRLLATSRGSDAVLGLTLSQDADR